MPRDSTYSHIAPAEVKRPTSLHMDNLPSQYRLQPLAALISALVTLVDFSQGKLQSLGLNASQISGDKDHLRAGTADM